jgi:hypothetical protein
MFGCLALAFLDDSVARRDCDSTEAKFVERKNFQHTTTNGGKDFREITFKGAFCLHTKTSKTFS